MREEPTERARREVDEAAPVEDLARRRDRRELEAEEEPDVEGDLRVPVVEAMCAGVVAMRAVLERPAEPAQVRGTLVERERHARTVRVVRDGKTRGAAAEDREGPAPAITPHHVALPRATLTSACSATQRARAVPGAASVSLTSRCERTSRRPRSASPTLRASELA